MREKRKIKLLAVFDIQEMVEKIAEGMSTYDVCNCLHRLVTIANN